MSRAMHLAALGICCLVAECLSADDGALRQAIERGRGYLLNTDVPGLPRGEMALVTLALVKSEAPVDHPRLSGFIQEIAKAAAVQPYRPEGGSIPDTYETAVMLMALAAADANRYSKQIQNLAEYLLSRQSAEGPWDYLGGATGDTSQTQYAILSLWEASSAGVRVPMDVWDRCAAWLISRQDIDGGFAYHPSRPIQPGRNRQTVTHSMSVAGTGTLVICRERLSGGRAGALVLERSNEPDGPREFPLLIPVERDEDDASGKTRKPEVKAKRTTTTEQIEEAIRLGVRWLDANFTIEKPTGPLLYYLYGVERLGNLARITTFGSTDWFAAGSDYLIKTQRVEGSWVAANSAYRQHIETSFALLFLVQSTRKSAQRFQVVRLEGGDLTGGRGLPTSDEVAPELRQRQSARYRDALRTPVDQILESLATLDDAPLDESAAAAVELADPKLIAEKFGKDMGRLRRLAKNDSAEVREAAVWALARMGDLRAAPVLIERLRDDDPRVYRAALGGLRFLSRRMDGFGMPQEPPDRNRRERGMERWRQWFESLKLEVPADQEFGLDEDSRSAPKIERPADSAPKKTPP